MIQTQIKEKPILFSTPMVKAILDGRKTMTRRVIKNTYGFSDEAWFKGVPHNTNKTGYSIGYLKVPYDDVTDRIGERVCSPYEVGTRLWVRETWALCPEYKPIPHPENAPKVWYKVDNNRPTWAGYKWEPSIHMPKWAARIWLEVTDVRVQRLQDISIQDVVSEGISPCTDSLNWTETTINHFKTLWDSINAKRGYGWEVNPWVWCISFKRVEAST